MQKKVSGYFTVEAAMVMPIVLWVVLFVIYLLFFQYNRCLTDQDVGVLVLRGSILQEESPKERIKKIRGYAEQIYDDKYIAWDSGEIGLRIEKGVLRAEQEARIKFPFGGGLLGNVNGWEVRTSYENQILSPVSFVRYCRKWMGE